MRTKSATYPGTAHVRDAAQNVSRMLRAAREKGVLRFEVVRPVHRQRDLEERLVAACPHREAVVLVADGDATDLQRVGQLAASWLVDRISCGNRLAVVASHVRCNSDTGVGS